MQLIKDFIGDTMPYSRKGNYTRADVKATLTTNPIFAKLTDDQKNLVIDMANQRVVNNSNESGSTDYEVSTASSSELFILNSNFNKNDILVYDGTGFTGKNTTQFKTLVGLDIVENTTDLNKPISTATQIALDAKQNNIPYIAENFGHKNIPNGYAGLNTYGKISTSQLPSLTMQSTNVVGSEEDMLALTAAIGDLAIRTDEGKTYILVALPTSEIESWQLCDTFGLADGSVTDEKLSFSVNARGQQKNITFAPTGKVSFTPTTGTLTINNKIYLFLPSGQIYQIKSQSIVVGANELVYLSLNVDSDVFFDENDVAGSTLNMYLRTETSGVSRNVNGKIVIGARVDFDWVSNYEAFKVYDRNISLRNGSDLMLWGDSLTARPTGLYYETALNALNTGGQVVNGGEGGDYTNAIKDNILLDTDHKDWFSVIWMGQNDLSLTTTNGDYPFVENYIKNLNEIIAHLGHNRFLLMSAPWETDSEQYYSTHQDGLYYNQLVDLENRLAKMYGERYFNVREYLRNSFSLNLYVGESFVQPALNGTVNVKINWLDDGKGFTKSAYSLATGHVRLGTFPHTCYDRYGITAFPDANHATLQLLEVNNIQPGATVQTVALTSPNATEVSYLPVQVWRELDSLAYLGGIPIDSCRANYVTSPYDKTHLCMEAQQMVARVVWDRILRIY